MSVVILICATFELSQWAMSPGHVAFLTVPADIEVPFQCVILPGPGGRGRGCDLGPFTTGGFLTPLYHSFSAETVRN